MFLLDHLRTFPSGVDSSHITTLRPDLEWQLRLDLSIPVVFATSISPSLIKSHSPNSIDHNLYKPSFTDRWNDEKDDKSLETFCLLFIIREFNNVSIFNLYLPSLMCIPKDPSFVNAFGFIESSDITD